MRAARLFLLSILLTLTMVPARADGPVPEADANAIRGMITRQLEAFKRDDGVEAFSYAAPNIRDIFMTPERFMAMVRQGYQPVYRPKSYEFRSLEYRHGALSQAVEIVGPDNDLWMAVYTVEKQPDGSWKITGCYMVKSEARIS